MREPRAEVYPSCHETSGEPVIARALASTAKPCILLADDNTRVRGMIKMILEGINPLWEIIEAETGAEALQKILALKPDVALLDLNLPDMTGNEAAHRIRKLAPLTKIVFCSLSDESVLSQAAQDVGADAFISKMASIDEFGSTLKALIPVRL